MELLLLPNEPFKVQMVFPQTPSWVLTLMDHFNWITEGEKKQLTTQNSFSILLAQRLSEKKMC